MCIRFTILKMLDEKFKGTQVWEHVVIAYSRCNEHDNSWRSKLDAKKHALQEEIKKTIEGCEVDVKVITLGGGQPEEEKGSAAGLLLPTLTLVLTHSGTGLGDFPELWSTLQNAEPLDTTHLRPFEGEVWQKYEGAINERDNALAKAAAAMIYTSVMIKVALLLAFFLWRAALLPTWMGILLLNLPNTIVDELIVFGILGAILGPTKCKYVAQFFYQTWIEPYQHHLFPSKKKSE